MIKPIKSKPFISAMLVILSACYMNISLADEGVIKIPTVPANLVQDSQKSDRSTYDNSVNRQITYTQTGEHLKQLKQGKNKHPEQYPLDIDIKPGVNEIITIARNVGNRIVFPFEKPTVHTFNKSEIKQSGNVIYVATNSKNPLGIFVTDSEDETVAISLTLIPRDIPPREVRLKYKGYDLGLGPSRKKSERWEKQGDFESMVKELLKKIALREAPPGFSLVKKFQKNDFLCEHHGVKSQLRQVVRGSNLEVGIRMMENISSQPIELYEPGCYTKGVVAVAGWPTSIIKPGEATEIYIVRKVPDQHDGYGRESNLRFDY